MKSEAVERISLAEKNAEEITEGARIRAEELALAARTRAENILSEARARAREIVIAAENAAMSEKEIGVKEFKDRGRAEEKSIMNIAAAKENAAAELVRELITAVGR